MMPTHIYKINAHMILVNTYLKVKQNILVFSWENINA